MWRFAKAAMMIMMLILQLSGIFKHSSEGETFLFYDKFVLLR